MKNTRHFEKAYKELLKECSLTGSINKNRTSVDTIKLFNRTLNINLTHGFPIVTGKKIFFNKALAEFLWIYNGKTDLKFLNDNGINWWDSFAKEGELGKIYGHQIRNFNDKFDQIKYVIEEIKANSRRAVISLWNPTDLEEQALPCCYTQMTFVRDNENLNLAIDFRSSDLFLGLPYDIIFGALLLTTIARQTGLNPNILGLNLKDAHIYENHRDQVREYCKTPIYKLPRLLETEEGFKIEDYKSGGVIKAKLVIN